MNKNLKVMLQLTIDSELIESINYQNQKLIQAAL